MLVTVVFTFFFSFFNVALLAENLRSHSVSSGYMFRFLVTSESLASDNSGQWLPSPESHLSDITSLSLSLSQWTSPQPRARPPPPSPRCPPQAPPGGLTTVTLSRGSVIKLSGSSLSLCHISHFRKLLSHVYCASSLPADSPAPLQDTGKDQVKVVKIFYKMEKWKSYFSIFLRERLTLFIPCPQKTPYKVKTQMFWIRCVYIRKLCGNLNAININSFNNF